MAIELDVEALNEMKKEQPIRKMSQIELSMQAAVARLHSIKEKKHVTQERPVQAK